MTYVEAAGGSRDLREGQEGVATAKVVGLTDTIWNVAAFAGVAPQEYGGIHGIRDAILMPDTDQYTVVLLVLPDDNPASFNKEQAKSGEPLGVPWDDWGRPTRTSGPRRSRVAAFGPWSTWRPSRAPAVPHR